MAPIELRITEYNEAGDLVASYISSSSSQKKELTTGDGGGRVDIIVRQLVYNLLRANARLTTY